MYPFRVCSLPRIRCADAAEVPSETDYAYACRITTVALAQRTGGLPFSRRYPVFQHRPRGTAGASHAGVHEEALRSHPVSRKIEAFQVRHPLARAPGEASAAGRGQRADGFHTRQVLALDEHFAPAGLRPVQQVLEVSLVLAWVSWMSGI